MEELGQEIETRFAVGDSKGEDGASTTRLVAEELELNLSSADLELLVVMHALTVE